MVATARIPRRGWFFVFLLGGVVLCTSTIPGIARCSPDASYSDQLRVGTHVELEVTRAAGAWYWQTTASAPVTLARGTRVRFDFSELAPPAPGSDPGASLDLGPRGNLTVMSPAGQTLSLVINTSGRVVARENNLSIGDWAAAFIVPVNWTANIHACNRSLDAARFQLEVASTGHTVRLRQSTPTGDPVRTFIFEQATGKLVKVDLQDPEGDPGAHLEMQATNIENIPGYPLGALLAAAVVGVVGIGVIAARHERQGQEGSVR